MIPFLFPFTWTYSAASIILLASFSQPETTPSVTIPDTAPSLTTDVS